MSTSFEQVTDLEAVFGAMPGEDRVLIDWDEMCDWLDVITESSPFLKSQTLGESTNGRELRMIIASSPDTISNLESVRSMRASLKDTKVFQTGTLADYHLAGTKPVIMITAGIHATEVGGVQMMPSFIRDIAIDERYHRLLEDVILLIVPTLNPDGMDLVHSWYRETLGTAAEGTSPPALYHQYAGHDNNRDWYQHRLQETRVMVEQVHRVWFPHVVVDLHQMGQKSPRYVVPPYIDPAEIHVHPLIYQLAGELGTVVAADHTRAENRGVCSGVMFDCYSPTRAYQHYHGGVRILAEAASANIASPCHVPENEQQLWWDSPTQFPSVHMALPWRGGTWHLADIIRYHRQTVDSVLESVAQRAERWMQDQWRILSDQVNLTNFGTLVIPHLQFQNDPAAARELATLLQTGDVEVYVAEDDDGVIRAGSLVIPVQQPFGSYASALLALSIYPPVHQAYDVTSHCLPIHMGVEVEFYDYTYAGGKHLVETADLQLFQPAEAADIRPNAWLAIDVRSHASIRLVNHALRAGSRVLRLEAPAISGQRLLQPGTWIVGDSSTWDVMAHAARMHVRTQAISPLEVSLAEVRSPRLGLYDPQHGSISDFGWLRLWLERAGFAFQILNGEDIIHGGLESVDTLLIPHGKPELLIDQYARQPYPAKYTRGLSERISSLLRTWLHRGGHLVAFEGATVAISQQLGIDLLQPLAKQRKETFSSSGAVVKVIPEPRELLTIGIDEPFPVMYFSPNGFDLRDTGTQHSIAKFAHDGLVLSGAIHAEKHLRGLHAVVQMTQGEGRFTAFAYRPHFRTQMLASEQLLTNVIMQQFESGRKRS